MIYFVAFIVLLGVLIFVHEFGHFIIAKIVGVKVQKFSLGFPPPLVSRKWGETEYILGVIPLGGYVKLLGEDPASEEEIPEEEKPLAFTSKPLWARISVILAGPMFNYLLAVLILCAAYMAGLPVITSHIGKVVEGSPAMAAGMKVGDQVVAIDDVPVWRFEDMRRMIEKSPGNPLKITVDRDGSEFVFTVTPQLSDQKNMFGEPVGRIGVAPSGQTATLGLFGALLEGARYSWELTEMIWRTLVNVLQGNVSVKALGGPIMIGQAAGESLKVGLLSYLVLMAFISVNLAVINLLPIPVLDGGHLVFFLIEAVIRRPVTGWIREVAVQVGLLFIVFLVCLVMYNDISRIITQGWQLIP